MKRLTNWICLVPIAVASACSGHNIEPGPAPAAAIPAATPSADAAEVAAATRTAGAPGAAASTEAARTPAPADAADTESASEPAPPAPPLVHPTQLDDAEVARRIATLDSLMTIPVNAYDIHDKGRGHIRRFTDSLQRTLLTPRQTGQVAAYLDELLERHPEATKMISGQKFVVENLTPGRVAPNIVGKDIDGVEFELEDYRGSIVVLFFTGEWCAPCRAEYPHQRRMLEQYEGQRVVLLGVNSDGELERVHEAKEREGLDYRTWWDESTRGPIAQSWIVWSWPTTYILDEAGVVRYVRPRSEQLFEAVDELLRQRRSAAGAGS